MFVAQLEHPDFARFDLTSLRTGIMSGAPCPLPLMEKVVSRMGIREICIGYGQTEASPLITLTSVDDPIEVRVGTVGTSDPGAGGQAGRARKLAARFRPAKRASCASAGIA